MQTPLFNMALGLIALSLSFSLIYRLRYTRLGFKRQSLLQHGFIKNKVLFSGKIILAFGISYFPLVIVFIDRLTAVNIAFILVVFPLIVSFVLTPEVTLSKNAKLVITKPLFSTSAAIHLKSVYQDFDRSTYKELILLADVLPRYGVKEMTLTSPMFYHNKGGLRNFDLFETLLQKKGFKFSHHPTGTLSNIIPIFNMLLTSHPAKKEKLANIHLLKWYALRIELQPITLQHKSTHYAPH